MTAKKALSTLAALSADGAIAPLVPLLDLVGRLGEAQHLPAKVAARLLLTKLSERPDIALYRPGPAGDYCRRVTDADEFGVDALAPPRFEVLHRYADRTERREIATGRVSTVAHVDVLRSAGKLPPSAKASPSVRVSTEWLDEFHPAKPQPSLAELEERPLLRGRAGAVTAMQQRHAIDKTILIEVRQADALLSPGAAEAVIAAPGSTDGQAMKWTEEKDKDLAKEAAALKSRGDRHPTVTLAGKYKRTPKVIQDHLQRGRKLLAAEEAANLSKRGMVGTVFDLGRATKHTAGQPKRR